MCGRSGSPVAGSMGKLNRTVFQLGVQSEEECIDVANCNGPLQPNTGYYVKVRAFTESGFTDTAYSSKIRTGKKLKREALNAMCCPLEGRALT